MILRKAQTLLLFFFSFSLFCSEPFLQNIQQLTSSESGFEKAGEAYFSPNGTRVMFRADYEQKDLLPPTSRGGLIQRTDNSPHVFLTDFTLEDL